MECYFVQWQRWFDNAFKIQKLVTWLINENLVTKWTMKFQRSFFIPKKHRTKINLLNENRENSTIYPWGNTTTINCMLYRITLRFYFPFAFCCVFEKLVFFSSISTSLWNDHAKLCGVIFLNIAQDTLEMRMSNRNLCILCIHH